ncbi:MAG: UDP-3-O-(3-hydroxymyristoyl)glucosamine N-acyltransferase [Pseudomonadota bacterium]
MSDSPAFFPPIQSFTASQLAQVLGLDMVNASTCEATTFTGVAPLEDAGQGQLTFLDNKKYVPHLEASQAGCVILGARYLDALPEETIGLISTEPYRDFAKAAALLFPAGTALRGAILEAGISPDASIHPDADIEDGATVEAGAVIGSGAAVGAGAIICAGAVIGHHCQIGRGSYIGPRASVQHTLMGDRCIVHSGVCLGQDGFGFAMGPQGHLKVPQLGRVIVQDDVEIGAGTCIDRGTNRDTMIGEGTKIDNLVQIGHNVQVGRHCVIVGQVGIAGSTTLEDFVVLGGQVGVAGHLRIGMGAQIAGSSNIKDDVPPGARWAGTPAKPARTFFRELAAIKRLAER